MATMSVVVPARDEVHAIGWAVDSLVASLGELCADGVIGGGEVIVVDDRSTDGTAAAARQVAAGGPIAVGVVEAAAPGGFGAALRTGLAAAGGDLVLYTDADLPFDPGEIRRLVRVLDRYRADLVCGYRLDRTSEGLRRTVQSHAYNVLVRVLLPVRVRDVNFACKLMRRSVVDAVVPELVTTGSFIDAELLARCDRAGFRLEQVGVDYFARRGSASTLGGWSAIVGILRDLCRLGPRLRRLR